MPVKKLGKMTVKGLLPAQPFLGRKFNEDAYADIRNTL
jgi:hypothetical protein